MKKKRRWRWGLRHHSVAVTTAVLRRWTYGGGGITVCRGVREKACRPGGVVPTPLPRPPSPPSPPRPSNDGRSTLPPGLASHRPTVTVSTSTTTTNTKAATNDAASPLRPDGQAAVHTHTVAWSTAPRQCSVSGFPRRSSVAVADLYTHLVR